jgi:hypothetical protein
MAKKQFSANIEFTEREFRAPVKTTLNETKTGAVLPATTGQCLTPIVIENETQLISNFGYPNDYNYKYWFDCSGYLKQGSNLTVVRPLIEGSENAGLSVDTNGVVTNTIKKDGLYNEDVAMNTLENSGATTGSIEFYNRYVTKTNDLAIAVISSTSAYNAPLFDDTKLVSGLSYYFKKPVNYINSTATKYDIESLLNRSSLFASNFYAHIYQGNNFVVDGAEPDAPDATTNANKVWIDSDITERFVVGSTHDNNLVAGTKYAMTVTPTVGAAVTIPVIALANTLTNTTRLNSLADDSAVPVTGISTIVFKDSTNSTVVTISASPTLTKKTNAAISLVGTDGTYDWTALDLFISHAYFTIDAAYYRIQKTESTFGTGANLKYCYDFTLDTGKFPELSGATGNDWHLIIDGNDYNIDVDGKLYNYDASTNALTMYGWDSTYKKPAGGYKMVYTKDANGAKVLSKIVPKYLVDGFYKNDGSLVTGKEVVAPTPNFSKNELAVLVFKKEFNSGLYDLVESHVGNYSYDAKNSAGASSYIETVINKNSSYIYCNADSAPDFTTVAGINTVDSGIVDCMIRDTTEIAGKSVDYSRVVNLRNGDLITDPYLSATDMRTAADEFSVRGNTNAQILIGYDNGLISGYYDDMPEIAKESGMSLAIVSYDSGSLAGQKSSSILTGVIDAIGNKRQDTTSGMLTAFNDCTFVIGTSKLLFDRYNNKDRWLGFAGDFAGKMTANDTVNGSWFAVAGTERGIVSNYKRLLWSPSQTDQNELSRNGIDFIVNDKELGYAYLFEYITNTTENKMTAEANIRRLLITLKDYMRTTLKGTFFSFNDAIERNAILYKITDTFENIKSRRGLYDYRIICDETNNTADVINQQQFVVDVLIQPTRLVKYIKVNFSIFDAGFNIQEFEI